MTNAGLENRYVAWLMEDLIPKYVPLQVKECQSILSDENLMTRLQNSEFDLTVTDVTFQCPIVQYLKKEIGIPFVGVSPVLLPLASPSYFANRVPFNPSYMAEFSTAYDHIML